MSIISQLLCFHDWQIMFKYPDAPKTDTIKNPIGIVPGFKYLEQGEMVRMSEGHKIWYCSKCQKERKAK